MKFVEEAFSICGIYEIGRKDCTRLDKPYMHQVIIVCELINRHLARHMCTLYQPLRPVRPVSLQVSISTGKRSIEIEDAREKSNIFSSLYVLLNYFI